ncbi:MAG: hypothetical protein O9264_07045 [Leptospira sp.]|nr:hypothetical protein [Leptospira sp.]
MHRTLILDKPKAIILLLLCILGINIFAEENYPVNFVLDKDTVFQGTTFKSGSKIYLNDAGQIEKVILNQDQVITDFTFRKAFAHIWKKDTVLIYKTLFRDRPMPEIPNKIITVKDQYVFGFLLPPNCELSPSTMILTVGNKKDYEVSSIEVNCPTAFKIKEKDIAPLTTIQIHSKEKVTRYNKDYREEEI